jgi:hypothetical protein
MIARSKARPENPFPGLWHIVLMYTWGEDYFNEEAG